MRTSPFIIGIVAPSCPLWKKVRPDLRRAVRRLRQQGIGVKLGRTVAASGGMRAGSIEKRVADIHAMFADKSVDAIVSLTGGFNANELLKSLDLDLIRRNRKPFVGYSDITSLILPLFVRCGIPAVHGPMLADAWHDPSALDRLLSFLRDGTFVFDRPAMLWEGRGEPRRRTPSIRALPGKKKTASGPIIAGNLSTFNLLLGTPYMPSLKGAILFLEYDKEEAHALPSLQRLLWQVRQSGAFDVISALVFGTLQQVVRKEETPRLTIRSILKEVTDGYRFPVLFDAPFGHIYPSWILPIGKRIRIDGTTIRHI